MVQPRSHRSRCDCPGRTRIRDPTSARTECVTSGIYPSKKLSRRYELCTRPRDAIPAKMLTEQFVASISAHTKANTGVTKDAGIFLHEVQPLAAQRHVFKKSASAQHGLAVSSSHVFAAQAEKAVVHVYSREKGNQEAIIAFPERIHSIALAAKDSVLLLGTESGRVLAWEVRRYPLSNTLSKC